MSSTRRADSNDPLSYEKYMSAPEFAALRPIPGNVVLSKALLYTDAKTRELAFFLQAMSMQPGGLKAVAEQLVAWFPERCREEESAAACGLRLAESLKSTFDKHAFEEDSRLGALLRWGRASAEALQDEEPASGTLASRTTDLLAGHLIELALNPKLSLLDVDSACFDDLESALHKYKEVYEQSAWDGFVPTTTGRAVHETLDQALKMSRMVVVEGPAGAGKSTNAKVWCAARPGLARYISLTGITNRTIFFQKVGAAIGLATCQRKAQELQAKIEDFFARSKMMLVVDEAHYLWPQSLRVTSAPELIDWVNTALVNQGVPVGLLCTDQFAKLKSRVERNTGWTSQQFEHRVFRFKKLDEKPTCEDVTNVTRTLLSSVWDEKRQQWIPSNQACSPDIMEALVGYAMEQPIPFSCVSSCIHEARGFASTAGRVFVSRADIKRALGQGQIPSDAALSRAFTPAPAGRGRRSQTASSGEARKPNRAFVSGPQTQELRSLGRNQNLAVSPVKHATQASVGL